MREGDDCPFHGSPRKVVGTHNGTGLGRLRREYVVCELAGWCISSYAGSDRAILLADGTISYKWFGEISLDELTASSSRRRSRTCRSTPVGR